MKIVVVHVFGVVLLVVGVAVAGVGSKDGFREEWVVGGVGVIGVGVEVGVAVAGIAEAVAGVVVVVAGVGVVVKRVRVVEGIAKKVRSD